MKCSTGRRQSKHIRPNSFLRLSSNRTSNQSMTENSGNGSYELFDDFLIAEVSRDGWTAFIGILRADKVAQVLFNDAKSNDKKGNNIALRRRRRYFARGINGRLNIQRASRSQATMSKWRDASDRDSPQKKKRNAAAAPSILDLNQEGITATNAMTTDISQSLSMLTRWAESRGRSCRSTSASSSSSSASAFSCSSSSASALIRSRQSRNQYSHTRPTFSGRFN